MSGKLMGYLALKPLEEEFDLDAYVFFPAKIKPERMLEEYGKYWYDVTSYNVEKKNKGWEIIPFYQYYNSYTGKLLIFCLEPDKHSIKNLTISNSKFKKELKISGFISRIDMSKFPAGSLDLIYQHKDYTKEFEIYNVRDIVFRTKSTSKIPQFEGDITNIHRDTDGDGFYDTWISHAKILHIDSTIDYHISEGKLIDPYPIYKFEKQKRKK